jgi:heme/copper-type cytochrome/quinol oxidase subunit 2
MLSILLIAVFLIAVTALGIVNFKKSSKEKSPDEDIQEILTDDLEEMEKIWKDLYPTHKLVKEIHVHNGSFRILVQKKI